VGTVALSLNSASKRLRALEGMTGIVPPPSPLADFVGGRSLGA